MRKIRLVSVLSVFLLLAILTVYKFDITSATSPLGSDWIVYSHNSSGVYKMKSDGTGRTQIISTATTPSASVPQISPDRTKIYYFGISSGQGYLFSADSDGSNVSNTGVNTGNFKLSPDGTKIVGWGSNYYYAPHLKNYRKIKISNVDGSGSTEIQLPVPGNPDQINWNKDGDGLVFTLRQVDSGLNWSNCHISIAKIDVAGTNFSQLTPNDCISDMNPDVSPVDNKIMWVADSTTIKTMEYDGSNIQTLKAASSSTNSPTWSPDAKKVTYGYNSAGWWVVTLDVASGTTTQLSSGLTQTPIHLDWASKEYEVEPLTDDQLVYESENGINIINSDGTSNSLLVDNSVVANSSSPQISSDRKKVFYIGGADSNLHSIDVDGRNNTDLGFSSGRFSLSPSGDRVVSVGDPVINNQDHEYYSTIKISDTDGSDVDLVELPVSGSPSQMAWSNDGNSVVFQLRQKDESLEWGNCAVWIAKIDTDGSDFEKLTPDDCEVDSNPSVSEVDNRIAWSVSNNEIWAMDFDGTNASEIAPGVVMGINLLNRPSWSPDGSSLAVNYKDSSMGSNQKVATIDSSTGTLLNSGPNKLKVLGIDWQ